MFPWYSLPWIKLGQTSWRAASAKISAFYAITVPYSITGKLMRQTSMFLAPWSRVLLFDTVSLKSKNRLALLRSTDWCDPVIIPLDAQRFLSIGAVRQFSTNHNSSEPGCKFYNSFISLSPLTGAQMIKLYPSKRFECRALRHNENLPTNAIQHHSDSVK